MSIKKLINIALIMCFAYGCFNQVNTRRKSDDSDDPSSFNRFSINQERYNDSPPVSYNNPLPSQSDGGNSQSDGGHSDRPSSLQTQNNKPLLKGLKKSDYNSEAYKAIKKKYKLRGKSLPDNYYQFLLEFTNRQNKEKDIRSHLESYKKQLDFLNGLTDKQWAYLKERDIKDFSDPSNSYNNFEDFKSQVGLYVPLADVPKPGKDIAKYLVFRFESNKWPQLVIVENDDKITKQSDAKDNAVKLRWKYVTNNKELILPRLDYGHNGFFNLEYDILYIPPKTGKLYWQFYDFYITSQTDVKADSKWVGGIEIRNCYTNYKDIVLAIDGTISPSLSMDQCGDANWTPRK